MTEQLGTAADPVRVMVVDDSAVIRGLLIRALSADSGINVVTEASDGQMAVDLTYEHRDLDVVVLDIEMPVMDGLTALPLLIKSLPHVRIIMASTLTLKNAEISLRALTLGAADYVPKPSSASELQAADSFQHELISKVKALGQVARRSFELAKLAKSQPQQPAPEAAPAPGMAGKPFAAERRRHATRQHFAAPSRQPYAAPVYQPGPPVFAPPPAAPSAPPAPSALSPAAAPAAKPATPPAAPSPASAPVTPGARIETPRPPERQGERPATAPAVRPAEQKTSPVANPSPHVPMAARRQVVPPPPPLRPIHAPPQPAQPLKRAPGRPDAIAIGSSTGGPQALFQVLPSLVGLPQPIFITQHMPPTFTAILAEHVTRQCGILCREAQDGEPVTGGRIYLAPGDFHMTIERRGPGLVISLNQGPPENFCRPSVEPMLRSLVQAFGAKLLSVILTGMGRDGADGCVLTHKAGGTVLTQDEATSVVWGMPGAVAHTGIADAILPLGEIGPTIQRIALRTAA
jgi:two-component system chemotaxis response regulator CheB